MRTAYKDKEKCPLCVHFGSTNSGTCPGCSLLNEAKPLARISVEQLLHSFCHCKTYNVLRNAQLKEPGCSLDNLEQLLSDWMWEASEDSQKGEWCQDGVPEWVKYWPSFVLFSV